MNKELQTKAGFKAWRESLGISKQAFADMMHITVKSVSRWENPAKENFPPQDAWDLLERCQERFDAKVELFIQIAQARHSNGDIITIGYFHDQQTYESFKTADTPHYMMENTACIFARIVLENMGYKVVMEYLE